MLVLQGSLNEARTSTRMLFQVPARTTQLEMTICGVGDDSADIATIRPYVQGTTLETLRNPKSDHTYHYVAQLTLEGLTPDRQYACTVTYQSLSDPKSDPNKSSMDSSESSAYDEVSLSLNPFVLSTHAPERIVFLSCDGGDEACRMRNWKEVHSALSPSDWVVHMGDQIYLDQIYTEEAAIAHYLEHFGGIEPLREILRSHHNIMVWDDHEVCDDHNPGFIASDKCTGDDSATSRFGDIDAEDVISMKRRLYEIFQESLFGPVAYLHETLYNVKDHRHVTLPLHLPPAPHTSYSKFIYIESSERADRLLVALLDTRSSRTETRYYSLGDMNKLKSHLEDADRCIVMSGQSTLVTAKPWVTRLFEWLYNDLREMVTHQAVYSEQVTELLKLVEKRKGILVGGDIHAGQEATFVDQETKGEVPYFTSSAISSWNVNNRVVGWLVRFATYMYGGFDLRIRTAYKTHHNFLSYTTRTHEGVMQYIAPV